MAKKKILMVFGTRPEAIKMIPIYFELLKFNIDLDVKVCVTAQHRNMLDQVLEFFGVVPDYDLDLMKPNQDLFLLTSNILNGMKSVLLDSQPDLVLVHGDTTTSMAVSLAAFYHGSKVGHVEAGLRTFNKRSPFPEEINRNLTAKLADYHFAPTGLSRKNLISEGINQDSIIVTGNTVIDALLMSKEKVINFPESYPSIIELKKSIDLKKKIILVTGHRRENFGDGFLNICKALRLIAEQNPECLIIYPVHLNPNVQKPVNELLSGIENIKLINPQPYESFIWLMNISTLIITDSGGVQEEAPSLGKPVLVMRNTTERPEAVEAGTVILVGTNTENILIEANNLLHDDSRYMQMSLKHNPYGDGLASIRIVEFIVNYI
jgi:UDP-N-acetylglucosamine 2-epimerase (non-hydrolysing)